MSNYLIGEIRLVLTFSDQNETILSSRCQCSPYERVEKSSRFQRLAVAKELKNITKNIFKKNGVVSGLKVTLKRVSGDACCGGLPDDAGQPHSRRPIVSRAQ